MLPRHFSSKRERKWNWPSHRRCQRCKQWLKPTLCHKRQPQQFYLKIKYTRRENTRTQQTQQMCISLTFASVLGIGSVNTTVTQTCFFLEAMDRTTAKAAGSKGQWENKHCGARRATVEDGHSVRPPWTHVRILGSGLHCPQNGPAHVCVSLKGHFPLFPGPTNTLSAVDGTAVRHWRPPFQLPDLSPRDDLKHNCRVC